MIDGEPWFCAADVCEALGYANARDAIAKHCRAGGVAKRDTPTSSGVQPLTFINEGNLYRLCIKSHKPEAQKFEAWVCDEVLPAIRKTGRYVAPTEAPQPQPTAREAISPRDHYAIARVVWLISDQFKHSSSWSQGVWYYLRHALNNPAPNPWYVDQLTDMAAHLRSLYANAHAVHELTRAIEAEACKRLLRKGDAPERVLADLNAKALDHLKGHAKQLDDLPTWVNADFAAIASRGIAVHRMDGHLEQPGYFAALPA